MQIPNSKEYNNNLLKVKMKVLKVKLRQRKLKRLRRRKRTIKDIRNTWMREELLMRNLRKRQRRELKNLITYKALHHQILIRSQRIVNSDTFFSLYICYIIII